jgi:hypothetical protein
MARRQTTGGAELGAVRISTRILTPGHFAGILVQIWTGDVMVLTDFGAAEAGEILRLPSFLYCTESIRENRLFREYRGEPFDQREQPMLWHIWDEIIQHAALTEKRMGAPLAGV